MERRYEDALNLRFDRVADLGFAEISEDEMLRWFGRTRLTSRVWADLNDRWKERGFTGGENQLVDLHIALWKKRYIISWGEAGWMTPVLEWANGSV